VRLGERLRLGEPVCSVRRSPDFVELRVGDRVERFDRVVLATHADQALALLEDATPQERRVLGAFAYTTNEAVLHTDSSFLPRTPRARSSWNYRLGDEGRPTVTYHLNRLQAFAAARDYCVTLNEDVAPEHVLDRFTYEHPLYTVDTVRAQAELPRLAGGRTHYAGAYFGNGFHEDGLASGIAVAAALGADW
jgi:predicted NAD/FAD-binding protein